uniref:Reticulon domain-containing protein n=1 Tax=Glycine max TaxID=3847 RepID=K7L0Q0_SOYBN
MARDASSSASETRAKLSKWEKPMQEVLRRGNDAATLLWRNINVLASLLIGMTVIWFLIEIVEYNFRTNFRTLIFHIFITMMLVLFIYSTFANILKRGIQHVHRQIN